MTELVYHAVALLRCERSELCGMRDRSAQQRGIQVCHTAILTQQHTVKNALTLELWIYARVTCPELLRSWLLDYASLVTLPTVLVELGVLASNHNLPGGEGNTSSSTIPR